MHLIRKEITVLQPTEVRAEVYCQFFQLIERTFS